MIYLTADFGSTNTKLTAIDAVNECVIATSSSFTTIETDVMIGYNKALEQLTKKIPGFKYDKLLCCSSAGGGLKMVALGLVPELTAKAAKMAASSAGAKVVRTYSYEISKDEQDEIYEINPDLVLLCGGTDGGNKEVIISNARRLCEIDRNFSVIAAGNKSASYDLEEIFKNSGNDYVITKNVMPAFGSLEIEPAKESIRQLFIKKIIDAKGLHKVQAMTDGEVIPTPLAVLKGCELLSLGTKKSSGIGEFLAVDLGGATTDVYSMSKGLPSMDNTLVKGIPEPYAKRTVEGDLGMRYSILSLYEGLDSADFSEETGISTEAVKNWVDKCTAYPETVSPSDSEERKIDESLAAAAVSVAAQRHSGIIEKVYTHMGEVYTLNGKDLSNIPYVIGIGGIVINSTNPEKILEGAKFSLKKFDHMLPKNPEYMLDKKYIFSSMGLLGMVDAELALKIMKKEIKKIEEV